MKLFRRFRQWRKSRKQLRQLHDIGSIFHSFDLMEKSGMISFDIKSRRLFIEEPLALIMMGGGAKRWSNFIQNCFTWLYHRQCAEAWSEYILKEELDAVRVASEQYAAMTRADIERVRQARRDEIAQSDMEPPKVEPFEFFVVRAVSNDAAAKPQPTENRESGGANKRKAVPAGEILAVGHYEPETEQLELGAWEDVSPYLNREEDKKPNKKGR